MKNGWAGRMPHSVSLPGLVGEAALLCDVDVRGMTLEMVGLGITDGAQDFSRG